MAKELTEFIPAWVIDRVVSSFGDYIYVNIFRLYSRTFMFLFGIKDTSYEVPNHYLDRFWRDCWEMMPEPQKICRSFTIKQYRIEKTYRLAQIRISGIHCF